ncbi:MAG: hypothetical protein ACOX13_08465 [Bacillota bacterium]
MAQRLARMAYRVSRQAAERGINTFAWLIGRAIPGSRASRKAIVGSCGEPNYRNFPPTSHKMGLDGSKDEPINIRKSLK